MGWSGRAPGRQLSKLARTEETFLRYLAEEDLYLCPVGEKFAYHYTNEEN
jgi:hypothetical protein